MALITLREYARRNNINGEALRYKAVHGKLPAAQKIGRDWLIDENVPHVDERVKNGKYVNWRKKKPE